MKIFSLINLSFNRFFEGVNRSLSGLLSNFKESYGVNTIFGQLIQVLGSVTQNILVYIEDSMVEQNKYTAQRKRSIYNLASISGYNPSMGKATTATIAMTWKPNNITSNAVIIPNKTKTTCSQTGLTYNICLPQESIVCSINTDNSTKYLTVVEGNFETQTFMSKGGEMYSENIKFSGDADLDFLEVFVNDEKWEKVDSVYDMDPQSKQYIVKTSLKSGIDLIFGNGQYGKPLSDGDIVKVTYLIHSGEMGNLTSDEEAIFLFADTLIDTNGTEVDGNEIFHLEVQNKETVNSGMYSDDIDFVREMIGMNSRALVLADAKNYKKLFNKFSFIGYNRTWSEPGSMIVNSLIMKNYKYNMKNGLDYFNLTKQDYILSEDQKNSIYNAISASGEQLAGIIFNIFDPEIVKYSAYIYVKMKNGEWDKAYIEDNIRELIGKFFSEIKSDIFIPKSDIVQLIKNNINSIDGVDVYFMSEKNEKALIDHYYVEKTYTYDPITRNYNITSKNVYLYNDENPNIGLDVHGNIWLDNNDQFPVLMGGWQYKSKDGDGYITAQPLTIVIE